MTKKEAKEIAIEAKDVLKYADSNNPANEIGFDLYEFELNDTQIVVFAYINKQDDGKNKWYSVYAGVEYEGGDTIYSNYDNSTEHLRVNELTDSIYRLANMYTKPENIAELKNIIMKMER